MSGKTCGTCACGQRPRVWCSCADQDKPAGQAACDDYVEASDSVEQVALDMLRELRAIEAFAPDNAKALVARAHAEAFRARLSELGVEW